MPILQATPRQVECTVGIIDESCTCIVTKDYDQIIQKLKAACLALGGSADHCQAE